MCLCRPHSSATVELCDALGEKYLTAEATIINLWLVDLRGAFTGLGLALLATDASLLPLSKKLE